jgi:hypothetical protein
MIGSILEIVTVDRLFSLIKIESDSARRSSDLAFYNRLKGKACGRNK